MPQQCLRLGLKGTRRLLGARSLAPKKPSIDSKYYFLPSHMASSDILRGGALYNNYVVLPFDGSYGMPYHKGNHRGGVPPWGAPH